MRQLLIVSLTSVALLSSAVRGDEKLDAARQRVWDFEQSLPARAAGPDKRLLSDVDRDRVRKFFTSLADPTMKEAAIGMLDSRYVYRVPHDLTLELLGKLVRDAEPSVQTRALRAISYNTLGDDLAEDVLRLSKSKDLATRAEAVQAMSSARGKNFLPQLIEALRSEDLLVRRAALGLTRFPVEVTAPEFRKLLNDKRPEVRIIGLTGLAHYVEAPVPLSTRELLDLLDDPDQNVQRAALNALKTRPGAETNRRIAALTRSASPHLRAEAAAALGELKAADQVESILPLLSDEDVVVRRYAVLAMQGTGGPEHASRITPLLKDEDEQVRKYAAQCLAAWKAKET